MRRVAFFLIVIFFSTLVSLIEAQTFTACPAATAQSYGLLHSFATNGKGPNDPRYSGIIAQSRGGNMFSTAPDTWTGGEGTAFKITNSGGVIPLHTFTGMDGAEAFSGLTLSTGGYYWGTT